MNIYLDNAIRFKLSDVDKSTLNKITKMFKVISPEYEKSDNKRSFSQKEKFIPMYGKAGDYFCLPRGVMSELSDILLLEGIDYEIVDKRLVLEEIEFPKTDITFYKHQQKIIRKGCLFTQGTFEAGCGSGKTIALIGLIMKCRQPALIIVPDKTLQRQWIKNIHDVFGWKYDKELKWFDDRIGMIGDGVYEYKDCWVTVAINASVYSHIKDKDLFRSFGFVAMDECHMTGARTFRTSIHLFPAKYRFGATATLYRNDSLSWFIEAYCGRKFCTITDEELEDYNLLIKPELIVRRTDFKFNVNFNYRNWYNTLMSFLAKNYKRNNQIVNDIINYSVKHKRLALVVSTSVNHCNAIAKLLQSKNPSVRIGFLTDVRDRSISWHNVEINNVEELGREGKLDIIFGVQRVKQGLDIAPIEDIYTISPRKSKVDVTQIVGRAMRPDTCFGKYKSRSDKKPCIYEYVDVNIKVLYDQYLNYRLPVYESRCIVKNGGKPK